MSEHTPGPWVGFADQGKCVAIMPAMREGDICTFQQPPSDADATLMIMAPLLLKALLLARKRIEYLGVVCPGPTHYDANEKTFLPAIDEVLSAVGSPASLNADD